MIHERGKRIFGRRFSPFLNSKSSLQYLLLNFHHAVGGVVDDVEHFREGMADDSEFGGATQRATEKKQLEVYAPDIISLLEEEKVSQSNPIESCFCIRGYWNNSGTILSDLEESRLGQVKVRERRIAPAAIVIGQSEVRWAKVGSGDNNRARKAPSWIVSASELVAAPTA